MTHEEFHPWTHSQNIDHHLFLQKSAQTLQINTH